MVTEDVRQQALVAWVNTFGLPESLSTLDELCASPVVVSALTQQVCCSQASPSTVANGGWTWSDVAKELDLPAGVHEDLTAPNRNPSLEAVCYCLEVLVWFAVQDTCQLRRVFIGRVMEMEEHLQAELRNIIEEQSSLAAEQGGQDVVPHQVTTLDDPPAEVFASSPPRHAPGTRDSDNSPKGEANFESWFSPLKDGKGAGRGRRSSAAEARVSLGGSARALSPTPAATSFADIELAEKMIELRGELTSVREERAMLEARLAQQNAAMEAQQQLALDRETALQDKLEELERLNRKARMAGQLQLMESEGALEMRYESELKSLKERLRACDDELLRLRPLQREVADLRDEVDLLRPLEGRHNKAQEALNRARRRLEDLCDVQDQLKQRDEAHAQLLEKCMSLEGEVQQLPVLRKQMDGLRRSKTDVELKARELQSLLDKSQRQVEALTAEAQRAQQGARALQTQAQNVQESLRSAPGEDQGEVMGVGMGVSELNPQVAQELARLRRDNAQLKAKLDHNTLERVCELEGSAEDAKHLADTLHQQLTDTRDKLEATEAELSSARDKGQALEKDITAWRARYLEMDMSWQDRYLKGEIAWEDKRARMEASWRDKLTKAEDAWQDKHSALEAAWRTRHEQSQQQWQADCEALESEWHAKCSQLGDDWQAKLVQQEADFRTEGSAMEASWLDRQRSAEEAWQAKLVQQEADFRAEGSAMEASWLDKHHSAEEAWQAKLVQQEADFRAEGSTMEASWLERQRSAEEAWQMERTQLEADWQRRWDQQEGEWQSRCAALEDRNAQAQRELEAQWQGKCQALEADWGARLQGAERGWVDKCAGLEQEWGRKCQELQEHWQGKHGELEAQSRARCASLEAQIEQANRSLAETTAEHRCLVEGLEQELHQAGQEAELRAAELSAQTKTLERALQCHAQDLAQRDSQLADQAQRLAQAAAQLTQRQQELAEQQRQLAERDQQLAERSQQLAERSQQLAEQERAKAAALAEVAHATAALDRHRSEAAQAQRDLSQEHTKAMQDAERQTQWLMKRTEEEHHRELDDARQQLQQYQESHPYSQQQVRQEANRMAQRLQAEKDKVAQLEQDNEELTQVRRRLEREKMHLWEEADRFRRQATNRNGDAVVSVAQFEALQREVQDLMEENRVLKRKQESFGSPYRHAPPGPSPASSPSSRQQGRSTRPAGMSQGGEYAEMVVQYDVRIKQLSDERRDMVMKYNAATSDKAKLEQQVWRLEEEARQTKAQLTKCQLRCERLERQQQALAQSSLHITADADSSKDNEHLSHGEDQDDAGFLSPAATVRTAGNSPTHDGFALASPPRHQSSNGTTSAPSSPRSRGQRAPLGTINSQHTKDTDSPSDCKQS